MAGLGNLDDFMEREGIGLPGVGVVLPALVPRFDPVEHAGDGDAAGLRRRILGEIAERWSTAGEVDDDGNLIVDALAARAVVGRAFVDANRVGGDGEPEAIAIREVVEMAIAARGAATAGADDPEMVAGLAIVVVGCQLDAIDLGKVRWGGSVVFAACDIARYASLEGARIGGAASLDEAQIGGAASLEGAQIGGSAWLGWARIGGDASLGGARIGGAAWLRGARIGGDASLGGARIGGVAWLEWARIGGDASLGGARIGGAAWLRGAWIGGKAWLEVARIGGDALLGGARIGGTASLRGARIGGVASLGGARIGGDAWLEGARIGGDALLGGARIGRAASLRGARIGGDASLGGARIGGDASLEGARIGGDALLEAARIGGNARVNSSSFVGAVSMHELACSDQFTGTMSLQMASWHRTSTDSASFGRRPPVGLIRAVARASAERAVRTRVELLWRPATQLARWLVSVSRFLRLDWFAIRWFERLEAFKRTTVGSWIVAVLSICGSVRRRVWWRSCGKAFAERAHWGGVRGFGELAILTRASNVALVVVPLLAGLWPVVRDVVQWFVERQAGLAASAVGEASGVATPLRTPMQAYLDANLPWVWGALFFAALLAVLGRAFYQAHCPQLIKEHSREDLIGKRKEEFQRLRESDAAAAGAMGESLDDDAKAHLSILEDALKLVQEAGTDARLSAFRHPNLVRVNGRTYWLPDEVKDFAYVPEEIDNPALEVRREVDAAMEELRAELAEAFPGRSAGDGGGGDDGGGEGAAVGGGDGEVEESAGGVTGPDDEADGDEAAGSGSGIDAATGLPLKVKTAEAWIPRTRREVIAVMAGADAEYDLEARRRLRWALASRWCYVLSVVLIGLVLWHQAMLIFWEMGLGIGEDVRVLGWIDVGWLHERVVWLGTEGLLWGVWGVVGFCVLWIVGDAVFGRDPLPDGRVIEWEVKREIGRELGRKGGREARG